MDGTERIRTTLERAAAVVARRPAVGQGTATTKAVLGRGLECEVSEGPFRFTVGMSEKYGGTDSAPNPGIYGRGALASCLVLGIAMWAARMEVPLDALEVEVEADYDVRGELGVSPDVPAGYGAMRYAIRATSRAPEDKVREMLDRAVRTSSLVDDFSRAVPVTGRIAINGR